MDKLIEFLRRHQLIAYFVLTYLVTWTLLFLFQPLLLEGQSFVAPLVIMGVFGPALVSIGLSAVLSSRTRQGSRKPAVIAFIVVWILSSMIILLQLIVLQQAVWSIFVGIAGFITGLLPAFVASSVFSTIPGVRAHLRTYIKPRSLAEKLAFFRHR